MNLDLAARREVLPYALELNRIGSLFASEDSGYPDLHKTLPEFFKPRDTRKDALALAE